MSWWIPLLLLALTPVASVAGVIVAEELERRYREYRGGGRG
jgi:hypothetical protein